MNLREELKKETTYNIIHCGRSISPNISRDEYYKLWWMQEQDVLNKIEQARQELVKRLCNGNCKNDIINRYVNANINHYCYHCNAINEVLGKKEE